MEIKKLRELQAKIIENKISHHKITAKDVMIKPIILHEDDEIETITKKLKQEDTNYCVIVNDENKYLGEISIENIIKIIAHTSLKEPLVETLDVGYRRGINFTTAKDHMTKNKNTTLIQTPVIDILKLIDEKNLSHLIVLDEQKEVKGLITQSSLLNTLSRY